MGETNFTNPQEFRLTTTTKVFYGIGAIALLGFAIFAITSGAVLRNAFMVLFPLVFVGGAILIIVNFRRRKVVVNQNEIVCVSLFSTKQLHIDDIKGYRIGNKILKIIPNQPEDPMITIRYFADFKGSEEIVSWLRNNFKDLDALDLEAELQCFLADETYGLTEDERKAKLKLAKELALAYNIWGGVFGFVFSVFNQQFTFIIVLIIPLVGIGLLFYSNLIKFFSNGQRSIYQQIFIGFAIPCIGLLFKNAKFNLVSLNGVWLPMMVFGIFILIMLYFKGVNRSLRPITGQIIVMIILVGIYSCGSFRTVNCALDKSPESIFKVIVLNKRIVQSKGTGYYLILNTWGPQQRMEEEIVSRKMFDKTKIGDKVTIKLKAGVLNTPWYLVSNGF